MILLLFFCLVSCFPLHTAETIDLDIVAYSTLVRNSPDVIQLIRAALREKGIVGVRVPKLKEKYDSFLNAAREFYSLSEATKQQYQPKNGTKFIGYELGKEKFQGIIDDLKESYYATIPNHPHNQWPVEVDLHARFEKLGLLMVGIGELLMHSIGLLGDDRTGFYLEPDSCTGRMLRYRAQPEGNAQSRKEWCGAHFDHGLFTALLPAAYFQDGLRIAEPQEAGLQVRTSTNDPFRKVKVAVPDDHDVMMFQVGEFAQLVTNDTIRATEHRVQVPQAGNIERYTFAVFFNAPMDTRTYSCSVLTKDERYGGLQRTFREWHQASFLRYKG